ncbi:MAG: serine hydrolase domain-containing protein [Thermoanaerobaculia bacterium]
MRRISRLLIVLIVFSFTTTLFGADALAPGLREKIDDAVTKGLEKSGAPSASIAVVRNGQIVYTNAYGLAQLKPRRAATAGMRYSIGSISKQFTAASILLLAEEGKISLDDKLVRWFPELTRSNEVTVREILSMTSGYQDFWPQDYVMPRMMHPVTPQEILDEWAKKPLDFEPGTQYQYSNTNYVIAGALVQKVAGMPIGEFLQQHVFGPLGMASVTDSDRAALGADQPMRYRRFALGPLRPAPKEGPGWMFAAGELAMTAHDLALWDIAMMDRKILSPESWKKMETEVRLANGVGANYGLGVGVSESHGHRLISHGGEVSGFTARNSVYPDDATAVVVLTNLDATSASSDIASKIAELLFETTDQKALEQAKAIFATLQKGAIDRSLLTANANAYFSDEGLRDFASSLGPLGKPESFTQQSQSLRGGMTLRRYTVKFPEKTLRITTFTLPDGKFEQYMVAAAD